MKTISASVLLFIGATSAATVQSQARSLAQSGVVMDNELGTEVLSNGFLQAEAQTQQSMIMQEESSYKNQQEVNQRESHRFQSMVRDMPAGVIVPGSHYDHRPLREPLGSPDDENHASQYDPTRSILRKEAEDRDARAKAISLIDPYEVRRQQNQQREEA